MLRSASLLAVLALSVPALALHPEHFKTLSRHHAEPHLASRHTAHSGVHSGHLSARAARAATHLAHARTAKAVSHHERASASRAHLSRAAHHHGALVAQPRHFLASTRPAHPAAKTTESVVAVIRPSAALPHPQLPPVSEAVTEPVALPKLYNEHGHLLVPAALVGSHAILLHQNLMADQDGLGRIQNDADLESMRERGMLVALPANAGLAVDERLPYNRRYSRPWTAQFLSDLSHDYYRRFHTPLQLTSAVRTVEFQQKLIHHNGNAAPADGDTASPHLTGQAIDLGKRGMTMPEIAWMRGYLLPLIQAGKIDVEEEFKQSCFHISVYRLYSPPITERYAVASRSTTTSLATVLP